MKPLTTKGWRKIKKFKRVVDNKMHAFGDTDLERGIIRVNKSKRKNKNPGDIIDTIVHEETHRKHPAMHERTVRKKTKTLVKKLGRSAKRKLYSLYK